MSDETASAAVDTGAPEEKPTESLAEALASEQEQPETIGESAEGEEAQEDGEQSEPVEEIEFDFGGNKLKVPKGSIPDEIAAKLGDFTKNTWADYTKKSQSVAEQRKALEAQSAVHQKLSQLRGETLNTYSQGLQVREELAQLQKVDLNALWQSDPDTARRVSDRLAQKTQQFQQIVHRVAQLEHAEHQEAQTWTARQIDEGKKEIARMIPGFNDTLAKELVDFAVSEGVPREQAERYAINPRAVKWAYEAMQFRKMQAKAAQAVAKPKPTPAPAPVQAMQGKSAKATPTDPSKMSMEQYVAFRRKQES